MAFELKLTHDTAHRRDYADHAVGDKVRAYNRQLGEGAKRDSNSPFNEAFTFSDDEYALLKKIKPHLFDLTLDPKTRLDHWKRFANSTEGRAFRVR